MEEGDLSAMSRGCVGRPDNVVVGAEEAIDPSVLSSTAKVLEIVHGTVEAGIAVLGAAAQRFRLVVGGVVRVDQHRVFNMSTVSIEGVDPGAEVGVFGTVDNAEDRALAVGGTSQEGNMGRIFAGAEASSIVGVTGDVVDDWGEPGVEGRIEVGSLECIEVYLAQAVDLPVAASRTSNLGGHGIKGFVDGCISRARDGVGTHLYGALKPSVRVIPEIVIDVDGTRRMTTKDDVVRVPSEGYSDVSFVSL